MSKILIKIYVVLVTFLAIMGSFNYTSAVEDKNLVSIVTGSETYFFNSSWDNQNHYNYSTGAATSESYVNSTIGYMYGQRMVDENGSGQANGWIKHWVDWECPVDNESGEINITYECCAYAFLGSNDSSYAYAKLVLTFFIDDEQHEVIIYNNTVNGLNNTDEFSMDSIENWSKNLTLHNKTYTIGVNASYEIEFIGNNTESIAWLSFRVPDTTTEDGDGNTEYWAVLVGVDYNWCNDVGHIPFDKNVEYMCNMLLTSDHWQPDHIKVLTNENATTINIIDALCWMDHMDDGDDISLVYYTAHGGNFKNYSLFENSPFKRDIDLPPIDEEDGYDEFLTTYWTAKRLFSVITDDLLNYLLGRLDSEGIAVIIDSCYSGGMIDSDNSSTWISKFLGEINQSGRVMMTCCDEDEEGEWINFARYMMAGLQGYADTVIEGGNDDGVVSAEEAFDYAYIRHADDDQHPVIDDKYEGELPLTDVDLPPSPPEWKDGPVVGIMNTPYSYNVSSIDPEDHNISYGWDWHEEKNYLPSAKVDEWTNVSYPSNETCAMSHLWNEPGIYRTLVKSKDEYGAQGIFYEDCWSTQDWTTIITVEDEIVDQFQIEDRGSIKDLEKVNDMDWHAQSFKPNLSAFSKIALKLKNRPKPVIFDIFIRDNLTGSNIAEISKEVKNWGIGDSRWIEFVFPDEIQVTPNETYYIVVMCHSSDMWRNIGWASNQDDGEDPDSYSRGEGWVSEDSGENWSCPYPNLDHCFVVYKLPEDNHPPNKPMRPSGPSTVTVNTTAEYSTSTSDPDGNQVYYSWDWGDQSEEDWDGPYSSGQTVYANHTWTEKGQYSIKVKAKDIYGVESEWSDPLPISVPLSANFAMSSTEYAKVNEIVYLDDLSDGFYEIVNWAWDFGDGNVSYEQNTSHQYAIDGVYNVTLTVTDNQSNTDVYYQIIIIESVPPQITNVSSNPSNVGFGFNVTISADVTDSESGIDTVTVNVTYPDSSEQSFTMANTEGDTYQYIFSDTWLVDQYNYIIWVLDNAYNSNESSGYSFNVSVEANINVCTIKDEYGASEDINITDPPVNPTNSDVGYELLDDGDVLRIWNKYDSYYFNTSSGIQLTNHYDEYWSHNVLMLGYYNNDQWNLIYRTDELIGFNKDIDTDNETYVNATIWKNLTYSGYDFRLAIRYHLGVDDNELTVIPYIKNLGQNIPYTLGFAWEINNIQIDMTPEEDYIEINRTSFYLNDTVDVIFRNMTIPIYCWNETTNESYICGYDPIPYFYVKEDLTETTSESLYLRWDPTLDYRVKVKSKDGEYNAPVTLAFKIGTLDVGQEKYTELFWHDASEIRYYFNSYDEEEAWATSPGNMIDSSTSNYASTTVNADVELCDGNTCSGSNLGSISKVELRVYGYYSQSQRDIILQPVFDGENDGGNYTFKTENEAGWSQWFDITNDAGRKAESQWTWNEVKNLDCDVKAEYSIFYPEFTLYCSKVEVRVTFTGNTAEETYFFIEEFESDWEYPEYMVDGDDESFAYTERDGLEQYCLLNICKGEDLGTILKVELRTRGYREGASANISLTPVFGGEVDGSELQFAAPEEPAWSEWFDITNDANAPSTWNWSDVKYLDCKVKSVGSGEFVLYCSKIEIRVNYSLPPNNAPTISNPSPSNGISGISVSPDLRVTVDDADDDTLNAYWYSNSSGSWILFATNTSIDTSSGSVTIRQTNSNFTGFYTTYYWSVRVTDGIDWTNKTYYFTTESSATTVDEISPYIQISSPLTLNASGSSDLDNVTLWYRYSSDNSTWEGSTWWNLNWSKRKQINLNVSSGSTSSGYQVKLNITYDSDMNNDFSDLRFVNYSDDTVVLDYWVESKSNGSWCMVWVEISDVITTTDQPLAWMYYGNSGAESLSDGFDTFLFFDDFSGSTLNSTRWPTQSGSITVSGGEVHLDFPGTSYAYASSSSQAYTGVLEFRAKYTYDSTIARFGRFIRSHYGGTYGGRGIHVWDGGANILNSNDPDVYHNYKIVKPSSNALWYFDDVYKFTRSISGNIGTLTLGNSGESGRQGDAWFDHIFIREYVSSEPSYSIGDDQVNGWMIWDNSSNPDTGSPWSWGFNCPNGTGYYEFYSIGNKSGVADESAPGSADARCVLRNQSKIINTGSTNFSGYLLIQIQYWNDTQSDWEVDNDTINETTPRTINVGQQLPLDLIFNGKVSTDDLVNGDGTYRVYAAFRDPDGDVLVCDDESLLEAWWEFEVDTS